MPGGYIGPVTKTTRPDIDGECHVITYATDIGAGRLTTPITDGTDVLIELTGIRPFRLSRDGAAALRDALDELLDEGRP